MTSSIDKSLAWMGHPCPNQGSLPACQSAWSTWLLDDPNGPLPPARQARRECKEGWATIIIIMHIHVPVSELLRRGGHAQKIWHALTLFGSTWTPIGYSLCFFQSSIWARIWLVKELLMTKLGWPIAQPRFTSLPSARSMMCLPLGSS